ncbi:protein yellow-like [Bradysia coprophila]|uniref:protein yellow-like n=1 Tax=Bradysia coprophila TaxID=38358 RepID=UPI00187D99DD|nr:protein yellow-like [Bradysia coprophila]
MKSDFVFATVTSFLSLLSIVQSWGAYNVLYQWKIIQYNIPSNVQLNPAEYKPQNNLISLLAIYEDRMWLVTPRYLRGVPVTLSTIPYKDKLHWWDQFFFPSPILQPFPNYEMNKIGDCDALQLAHALDIDQFGRLWVVDVGRIDILEETTRNLCPAKLVIFDVKNGRSDKIFTYTFPDDVAPPESNIVKDIQVACETKDDCWAYIADISLSRLVIYDHKRRESWTAEHPSMAPDPNESIFFINGVQTSRLFGITGIGLAPIKFKFSYLLYSPLASKTLYKVESDTLKNPHLKLNGTLNENDVIALGEKPGQSDGFAMTSKGRLYYADLPNCSVISTDTDPEMTHIAEQKTVAQSYVDLLWPKNFAFDGKGKLALTSTKFHLIQATNPTEYNFRVIILRHTGHVYAYNSR